MYKNYTVGQVAAGNPKGNWGAAVGGFALGMLSGGLGVLGSGGALGLGIWGTTSENPGKVSLAKGTIWGSSLSLLANFIYIAAISIAAASTALSVTNKTKQGQGQSSGYIVKTTSGCLKVLPPKLNM